MTREQARLRLESTTNFTFKGGRVLITDQRTMATIAELSRPEDVNSHVRMPHTGQLPTTTSNFA